MSAELPKQYDHQAAQARCRQLWEAGGYAHSDPDPNRKPFTIVIPPPNVTGALHLGHALNNTLQDALIRWRRMQGYNALWMPGTDHAGIATQAVVERRLLQEEKKTRHDLGRAALVDRIWAWKKEYEARILNQLQEMGCSCDWRRTRFTLDARCARAVRHTFFKFFAQGLIFRGQRLVNWDTYLQTAISDDELYHEAVKGHFWHFRYPLLDRQPGEPEFVEVATTRPETMLGDTAVAVHPDPAAALENASEELREKLSQASEKERPEIEAQLAEIARRKQDLLPHLQQLRDLALAGRCVQLPLLNRSIPLVADEWAKPELGTGCVKITPAHDPNDYEVGKRQNLPRINILNKDGTLNAYAGPYQGLKIAQAREKVVADLDALGLLVSVEDREIDLAHSDRSKTAIEPLLTDQWFVRMDQLAQLAMDAVTSGRVEIIPSRYAKSYLDWLSEKRDWPISRQLWWGHRIPVWTLPLTDPESAAAALAQWQQHPLVSDNRAACWLEIHEARQAAELRGGDDARAARQTWPYANLHLCLQEETDEPGLGAELEAAGFWHEEDVLDTWFSSALWPHSTLGWPDNTPELRYYYPTSVLITSRDIITLWVARMVLTGLSNVGDVPFKQVYIHPKILDGEGETMSKSKGNGVDPLDVIVKSGADALRFGLAYLTTETQDVRMPVQIECPHCSELIPNTKKIRELPRLACPKCGQTFGTQWARTPEDLSLARGLVVSDRFELSRNFCNKLWNAARFALTNLDGYSAGPVSDDALTVEDRWLLSRLTTVTRQVTAALEQFRYAEAARSLYDFAWDEFCSFYVEMVKGRLQAPEQRPTAQRVLAEALDVLLRLLHPFVPFLTEEIWQLLSAHAPERGLRAPARPAPAVMIAPWPQPDEARFDADIEARFACFQGVLKGLRELRSRQDLPPKEKITFVVRCESSAAALLQPMGPYFESMAKAEATDWGPQVSPPATCGSFVFSTPWKEGTANYEVCVDLAAFLDLGAEIDRKAKELAKLAKAIEGKQSKLANSNFVQRAPADVVQKERASLSELQDQAQALERLLEGLRLAQAKS